MEEGHVHKSPTFRRAAFDIGSSSTKLQCTECELNGRAVKLMCILHSQEHPVSFGLDLMRSTDGYLSDEIQEKGLRTLVALKKEAEDLGATQFTAIATEVFRKAGNGEAYLDKVRSLGIPVQMLTQTTEAELGFHSVVIMTSLQHVMRASDAAKSCICDEVAVAKIAHSCTFPIASSFEGATKKFSEACVWDSGGASFQITSLDPDPSVPSTAMRSYMGAFGSSISTALLVREVQSRELAPGVTANPVTATDIDRYMAIIKQRLAPVPDWLQGRELVFAAAGANCMFKLCCDILTQLEQVSSVDESRRITRFSLADAQRALESCLNSTDEQLQQYVDFKYSDGPKLVVPRLALLNGVMQHTGIKEVQTVRCVGSCIGLTMNDSYWS